MDLWPDLRETESENAEWIKLVEDSMSNTEECNKPPEFIQSRNLLNNYVIISFFKKHLALCS